MTKIPQHIGIIMDGNGRWARSRRLPRIEGHRRGVNVVRDIATACNDRGVKVLTLYAFSVENWKRPTVEVSLLMRLLRLYAISERPRMMRERMQVRVIGDRSALPKEANFELEKTIRMTSENDGIILQLALNYGGRDEIVRAARSLARKVQEGEIYPEEINEAMFASKLDTAEIPDPDLIIRTSGELRLSNFMTWQSAYSELYFSDCYWPDFDEQELDRAIEAYSARDRRFGGVKPVEERRPHILSPQQEVQS